MDGGEGVVGLRFLCLAVKGEVVVPKKTLWLRVSNQEYFKPRANTKLLP